MDILPIILGAIIFLLILALIYLTYLLNQQKTHQSQFDTQQKIQDKEQINNLSDELKKSGTEIQTLKDLLLTNFATNQASTKERFDYLDKSFNELNKVFVSSKRGMLGNSYLNELLAIILPQDKQVYQLE
jgi:cell division protein FtsB